MALEFSDVAGAEILADFITSTETFAGPPDNETFIQIRTGEKPPSPDTTATGTVLITIYLENNAFASTPGYPATLTGSFRPLATQEAASATGTAGWFRVIGPPANPSELMDGTITGIGGGGDMELESTSIVSGEKLEITSFVITMVNT